MVDQVRFLKTIENYVGHAFASARKIANPGAVIAGFGYKEIEEVSRMEQKVEETPEQKEVEETKEDAQPEETPTEEEQPAEEPEQKEDEDADKKRR